LERNLIDFKVNWAIEEKIILQFFSFK
jgi:hypothetical protein